MFSVKPLYLTGIAIAVENTAFRCPATFPEIEITHSDPGNLKTCLNTNRPLK
jgi:hypothetical protein